MLPSTLDILSQSRCNIEAVDVDHQGLPPEKLDDDINVILQLPATTAPQPQRCHCPDASIY